MEKYRYITDIVKSLEADINWTKKADQKAVQYNRNTKVETGVDPKTNAEYWLNEWENERKFYKQRGDLYHSKKLQESLGSNIYGTSIENTFLDIKKELPKDRDALKLQDNTDYNEFTIWLDSANVIGKPDKISIKNGLINVTDYKAYKNLKLTPYIKWDDSFERMKFPVNHLANINFLQVALQVNLYAYIIKRLNPKYKIGNLTLIHLELDKAGNLKKETSHDLPNLQKEAGTIINFIKEKRL